MADDYTPTDVDMREAWIIAHSEPGWGGPVDVGGRPKERIAEWYRWLAAHDAEKRAEWEAERVKVRHTFESDDCVTNECDCALAEQGETRWEYGTRRSVTDGWERGDRYGEREYVDARSVSDRVGSDGSTVTGVRDMTRAVRRRKAGPWEPVTNTESEGEK